MILALIVSRLIAFVLRLFNRGATTLPGRIALRIKPDILFHLSKGVKIICVTGTNGKTTTCALLESAFRSNSLSFFVNKSGANMLSGVVTSFVLNSTFTGKCKCDYAILECDENSLPLIAGYVDPAILVVTNVFRDQLDRYGEVTYTLSRIKQGIDRMNRTHLILNADCPLSADLACDDSVTFGIDMDFDADIVSDNRYCPHCNVLLHYDRVVYSQLGDYRCPACGYHRPNPDYVITDVIDDNMVILNGEVTPVSLSGVYNLYNFLSAYATCDMLGLQNYDGLFNFSGAFGRMETFVCDGRSILVLLVKNPVGLSNCARFVGHKHGKYDFFFALNDNPADGTDVSWIWDADLSCVAPRISDCYTIGIRSFDMALRLKYDGIIADPIDGEQYAKMIDIIRSGDNDFIIFSTYTSMMNMRHYLVDEFGGDEFWQ